MILIKRAHWVNAAWGVLFALGSVALVNTLTWVGALQPLEWMTYDARLRFFNAERAAPKDIAVILIDEASLQYLNADAGRWPWPRSVHADLLDFLARGKPQAVVFDILFVERQRDLDSRDRLGAHDARLVEATQQSGFTYHAMQLLADAPDEQRQSSRAHTLPGSFADTRALERHFTVTGPAPPSNTLPYNNFELPLDGLWQAARGVGAVRAEPDNDGRIRRMQLLHDYHGHVFPSLALAPLLDVLQPRTLQRSPHALQLDDLQVPLDPDGQMLINQYGNFRAYSYGGIIASLKQLNEGDVEHLLVRPDEFANSIVFVGADAVGVQDLKATPLGAKTAGVYLQASVAGNLLAGDFLKPAGNPSRVAINLILALLGALGALLLRRLSLKLSLLLGLLTLYTVIAVIAFRYRLVLDVIAPLLCAGIAWFSAFSYLFFTEGKDKRRVRTVLAQYVSPDVLAEVVDKYESYMSAEIGRRENISVLFSDIRGFTTVSESLTPEKVVEMLNVYFSAMTDVLFAHRGTIDKFIGDAIMAFWGAPVKNEQHALHAVRAALEMIRALHTVNEKLAAVGIAPLDIGVGINTGEAILGNIGSERKLAYTAIGDNVNLASRLEGLTKPYGCPVLISEFTYECVHATLPCRLIDRVRVKGKTHPIKIYAPLPANTAEEKRAALELCEATTQAYELYRQRRWAEAAVLYAALPPDTVREMFVARCNDLVAHPPGADWDSALTLTSK